MTTTSDTASWWELIAVFSDDYVPESYTASASVETNHQLAAGIRENDFDIEDQAYTYGLLTLAVVFLVAGLVACICLPCCYQCMGKSRQERLRERLNNERTGEARRGFLMLLFSVMALASIAGTIYGLEKTDSGLANIEDNTQQLADELRSIIDLVNATSAALDGVAVSYDALTEGVDACDDSGFLSTLLNAGDFDSLIDELQSNLNSLASDEVEELSAAVEAVSDSVATTEGVRKGVVWPAVVLSLLVVVVFILVSLSAYGCIACGAKPCGPVTCIILPGTVLLAIVVWLSAASAVTLSALSGDFCIEADQNAYDLVMKTESDEMVQEILLYYTGDCTTDNTIVDTIILAQNVALEFIKAALPALSRIEGLCTDLTATVDSIDSNLETVWTILDEAAVTTSCRNINGLYQEAVYDYTCHDLPEGLLGFWVSSAFLTVLLLMLAVLWGLMLRHRRTDKDFAEVQASAGRRVRWRSTRSFQSGKNTAVATSTKQLSARSSAAAEPTNPSASDRYAVAESTTSGSFTSGHYPAHTGRTPAAAPADRGGAHPPPPQAPAVTQQHDRSGFRGRTPPAQRPIVLDKPQRPHL